MNQILKQEGVKLAFSLLFMVLFLAVLYYALPKITEKAGASQASAFWTRERKEQAKRLFGGDDAV